MICVSLFDRTGNMLRPWHEAGYKCFTVDIQTAAEGNPCEHLVRDLSATAPTDLLCDIFDPGRVIAFVAAFPPCTHLAVSGARWFKGKGLRALSESIAHFAFAAEFCELLTAPYIIENPISTISTYWREPDHHFHPWHYTELCLVDNYTKDTCLWTGNGFVMPEPRIAEGLDEPDDRIHKAAPGPERANFRSVTPMGFAIATFQANSERVPKPSPIKI